MSSTQKSLKFDRYAKSHENPQGAGDPRPTALQIIKDEKMEGQLKDKVVLITGGSSGIGVETARAIGHTGAHVVFAVRDLKKTEAVLEDFKRDPDLKSDQFELLHMDMNSLDSVRNASREFLSKHKQLNILINNAGIAGVSQAKTEDGFESQFGVNHLAHFLLFQLLAPTLQASSTPEFNSRVVAVSSLAQRLGSVNVEDYNFSGPGTTYDPGKAYASSKVANIWFANELDRRYSGKGIHGISLHPGGIVTTGLSRYHAPEYLAQMEQMFQDPELLKTFKNNEQGAATQVLAAVGRDFEGKGAIYLDDCAVAAEWDANSPIWKPGYNSYAFDEEGAKKLWEDSLKFVGL